MDLNLSVEEVGKCTVTVNQLPAYFLHFISSKSRVQRVSAVSIMLLRETHLKTISFLADLEETEAAGELYIIDHSHSIIFFCPFAHCLYS